MKASTTDCGLLLLRRGVTPRLDPFAYAKVIRIIDKPGEKENYLLSPSRAGEIAASVKEEDRERLARQRLSELKDGEAVSAGEAAEFLANALREDQARSPTGLQERFIAVTAERLANCGEREIDASLRRVFPFPSLSFNLYFIEGLRKAEAGSDVSELHSAFVREFENLNRWPRRRGASR